MARTTRPFGISLTQKQLEELKRVKLETGVNISQLLLRSFRQVYLSNEAKK